MFNKPHFFQIVAESNAPFFQELGILVAMVMKPGQPATVHEMLQSTGAAVDRIG